RLLWARIGRPHCPTHGQELVRKGPGRIAGELCTEWGGRRGYVLAPVTIPASRADDAEARAEYLEELFREWREAGFVRALVDGAEQRLDAPLRTGAGGVPTHVALVVDRTKFDDRGRLVDAVEQAAALAHGRVVVRSVDGE